MILSDWIFAYVLVGIIIGMGVVYFNIKRGHVTNPDNIEKYVLLAMIFFMVAWPVFFGFVVYLMRKKERQDYENKNNPG